MAPEKKIKRLTFVRRALRVFALLQGLLGVRRAALTAASSFATSLLELVGLATVFPFIKLVTDKEFHAKVADVFLNTPAYPYMQDHATSILIVGAALILAFIFKALLHTLLVRYQSRVSARITAVASGRFVESALHARYQLFQKHGGVKIAALSYSNTAHAALLFQHLVVAANESIFIVAVLLITGVVYPLLCMSLLAAAGVLTLLVFIPLSRRAAALGRQTNELDIARHHFAFALASSIRDIKIMGLEASFALRNERIADEHAQLSARYVTIASILRTTVETLLFCGIVVGGIYVGVSMGNLVELAPILATAGLVAARSAPALSRLVGAYNGFRYSLPFVERLIEMETEILRFKHIRLPQAISFRRTYIAESVDYYYGNRQAVEQVTIKMNAGEVVAVVGASGSGKSTLLDLLSGLQPAASGRFTLDGIQFDPFVSETFSQMIGYVPQSITLLNATLEFNITFEEQPDILRLQESLRASHLDEFISTLPDGIKTLVGEGELGVSGGQRQRIGIARALYRKPNLLILDEVTSALDALTERAVMEELGALRGKTTLLVVTHRLSSVKDADTIYLMEKGRIVASGRHDYLLESSHTYRKLYASQSTVI